MCVWAYNGKDWRKKADGYALETQKSTHTHTHTQMSLTRSTQIADTNHRRSIKHLVTDKVHTKHTLSTHTQLTQSTHTH